MADETKDKTTEDKKDQLEETPEEEVSEAEVDAASEEEGASAEAEDDSSDEDEELDFDDQELDDAFGVSEVFEDDAAEDEDAEAEYLDDADEEDVDEDDDSDVEDVEDDSELEDVEDDSELEDVEDDSELEDVEDVDDDSDVEDEAEHLDDNAYDGLAAYFDYPGELLHAAEEARDFGFENWDAYSPFPIHGIEDAMGIGRSWLPWVTFGAGGTGFLLANAMQFGMLTFDWPMIIGGKPYAPWPSFVPIMFELTVLIGGVTSALVMFIAAGCFRKPRIIDREITNDRFVLWIESGDPKYDEARAFMEGLDPVEIRPVTYE